MSSLGAFGVKRDAGVEPETFEFFGETVRVNPAFGELDLADFMEAAVSVEDDSMAALSLLKGTFRSCVHAEDFDLFWSTAKRERQSIQDLLTILYAVVEAVTDRPTERPSGSSDGPQAMSGSSVDDSSLQVIHRLEREGRPSVALMVHQAQDSRVTA